MGQEKMSDTKLAKLFSDGVSNIETKRYVPHIKHIIK